MKLLTLLVMILLATSPLLAWEGQDAAGRRVEVPATGQVSVIVFIQPGQSHSEREMAEVKRLIAASVIRPVHVVAVVSGSDARARAAAIDAKQWTYPVAADEKYGCSGQFEVYAWPTTVLFDKAGKVVGRIPGSPLNFAARFSAYLDFAGGASTQDQLDQQLADVTVVEDDTDQKAARHLRLVDQLLAAGRIDDAQTQLQRAQDLSPTAEPVRLRLARALLLLNQAKQADDLLAAVDGRSARAGELALLRGWAASALGRWAQAENLLQNARKDGGPSAEIAYRIGVVYMEQARYREAAGEFRDAYQAATQPVR